MSHRSKSSRRNSSSSASSASSSPEHPSEHSLDDHETAASKANVFANDGSFLEMFKKYQQKQTELEKSNDSKKVKSSAPSTAPLPASTSSTESPVLPMIGKRRGGKILPTGKVKKMKNEDTEYEDDVKPKDAWSVYMSEVKRYRETVCQSDDKTRSLVK